MGCSSCGKKIVNALAAPIKATTNLVTAAVQQPDVIKWVKDGTTGLLKCLEGKTLYTDQEIVKNREMCRNCEHATKVDGKLKSTSQCMAPDPETKVPCGCFIVCKTQTDKCPLNKFTPITISK